MKFKPGDRVRAVQEHRGGDPRTTVLRDCAYTIRRYTPGGFVQLVEQNDPEEDTTGWRENFFELDGPQDFTNRDEGGVV